MMTMMMIGGSQPISTDKLKRVTAAQLAKEVNWRDFTVFSSTKLAVITKRENHPEAVSYGILGICV